MVLSGLLVFYCGYFKSPLCSSPACLPLNTFSPHMICISVISPACSQDFQSSPFLFNFSHSPPLNLSICLSSPCHFGLYSSLVCLLWFACTWLLFCKEYSVYSAHIPDICDWIRPHCSLIVTSTCFFLFLLRHFTSSLHHFLFLRLVLQIIYVSHSFFEFYIFGLLVFCAFALESWRVGRKWGGGMGGHCSEDTVSVHRTSPLLSEPSWPSSFHFLMLENISSFNKEGVICCL